MKAKYEDHWHEMARKRQKRYRDRKKEKEKK